MAEAPSLPREIPGRPLEGLPPMQPTVFCLPPGWGTLSKAAQQQRCALADARGAPVCSKKTDIGACW